MPDAHRHRRLRALIDSLDVSFLAKNDCFLGGAAPVVLSLGEYRLVNGVELACFGRHGYRHLREAVSETSLGPVFGEPVELARAVRTDRFGIRTYVLCEARPIRLDIHKEDRFRPDLGCGPGMVPVLSRSDLFVDRLLANADQYLGSTTISPPMVDLAMMVANWGVIPDEAWGKALRAYGSSVTQAYTAAIGTLRDADNCARCIPDLSLEPSAEQILSEILPKL